MRSLGVVEDSPLLDENFSLPDGLEYLPIRALVPELAVEAFILTAFPCFARQALLCNAEKGEPGVMWSVLT
jgi:hypothetical protein